MKSIYTAVLVILATVTIVGVIGTQQIYAPRGCSGCVSDFKKLTHEFEKDVINAIGDPNLSPGPIELLNAYVENVDRLFVGDEAVRDLVFGYDNDVKTAINGSPLEPEKQVKDFRALTHEFVKAVIAALEDDDRI
jgi:hypothetical protein